MKVVIAAAGTGGHINPGIAIANKIMEEDPSSEIMFIGTERGLEKELVPKAGYALKTIDSYGIPRKVSVETFKKLRKTIKSISQAKEILKEFNADLVIGTGGYICVSVCKAAAKLKIPYIMHESNALPGVSVKLLAKKADKVLLSFKEAKDRIKTTNTIVTGTPTKVKKLELNKEEKEKIKEELGLIKDLPTVLIFGGSQGAKSINESVIKLINRKLYMNLKEDKSEILYQIIMATGKNNYDEIKNEISSDAKDGIVLKPYIYNMEEVINIADVVVSRSGAMTITEIEKVGKASILIPYPYAAENHQEFNARALEKEGCAKVILDNDLNEYILDRNIRDIITDKNKIEEMSEIANSLSIENVEEKIYKEIKATYDKYLNASN